MAHTLSDKDMKDLIETLKDPTRLDEESLVRAISQNPDDERLQFIYGSTLASSGRLIEAHSALKKAVQIAPDFHIARFQLGLFQLTSGESYLAIKTWARLDGLPESHYLRIFAIGLRHLIRDELSTCVACLKKGIRLNTGNQPLNNDMKKIISEVAPLITEVIDNRKDEETVSSGSDSQETNPDEEVSLTSLLLHQSQNETTH